ncbi:NADH dehydrogenase [ubiquinone] 1 beta subcomplex subunit 5, mitochondrial [Nasonia vitripennis]|uniref:NADH dehydrogenase [ubiquinone] 1 beta subcomplex subunit 5, mitochondrial n=1 Tax=Nasonia vitripennis TaxID=7425 RepID=A0A7M6UFS4_NASVI|nr:NADH dehydrogenase [ubiquinone] 1 beta subcomplex subunit 5, mitochondrial [Nasonia vitripennis]
MAAWSTLIRSAGEKLQKTRFLLPKSLVNNVVANQVPSRAMSGHFVIQPTRWQWHKTKDLVHFYFMVAAIPLSILTFCVNIFVGPATLTPIPEDYEPKYWEYYRHPITRFLARVIFNNPQKDYEKSLHVIWHESQVMKLRELEKKVWDLQAQRQDYRYHFFLPYDTTAVRDFRELIKHDRDSIE